MLIFLNTTGASLFFKNLTFTDNAFTSLQFEMFIFCVWLGSALVTFTFFSLVKPKLDTPNISKSFKNSSLTTFVVTSLFWLGSFLKVKILLFFVTSIIVFFLTFL